VNCALDNAWYVATGGQSLPHAQRRRRKVSKGGWKYIEDDVDRYCPDRELILKLYEEADRLMLQQAQARP
jgi:hypothetical protein